MQAIHLKAAGLDLGADALFIAVEAQPVRQFTTFTEALAQVRDYLLAHGIETVAMEATGIYWVPLFDVLEQAGLEVCLVNGAHVKSAGHSRNVPGRKSDVLDCQWLQQLHSYGGPVTAQGCAPVLYRRIRFANSGPICACTMITSASGRCISSICPPADGGGKALELMNIKLHRVISQIQGASGLRVIEAILAGERDAERLTALCDAQNAGDRRFLKRKRAQVVASLQGTFAAEHLFALKQAVAAWRFYQDQVRACDAQIEALLDVMTTALPVPDVIAPPKPIRHHKPAIEGLHTTLMTLTQGRDAAQVSGLTDLSLLNLIGEVGLDMSRWPSAKHFTSWLGLSPGLHPAVERR